ncbi:unnamed protein product [Phytomonas sp. Hart1]|nr:unnamed protein product [Phytomonas sp. Hart1]|eukprot:CCW68957.1 unnamed protein product [Phytomonas sp. isolate Hart1]
MAGLEQRKLPKSSKKAKSSLDSTLAKIPSNKKWDRKMKEKDRKQRLSKLSKQLRDEINAEQKLAVESRKANAQRKQENERKNMVVQTIKNDNKIKKLSPKHRRAARIFMLHEL